MGVSLVIVCAVISNIICSILLVLVNKRLVVNFDFDYMIVLIGLHFLASFLMCFLLTVLRFSKYKSVNNYFSIFRISLGSLMSIVCMNYCLAYSSVGFYQVSKLFCIPISLLLEIIFGLRNQHISVWLLFSLSIILFGMYLVIKEEVLYNTTGLIWAILGVFTTSYTQIFFGPLKKDLNLDSLQLLFHTSPWLTFCSFVSIPILENSSDLIKYELTNDIYLNLIASAVIAAAYNTTNYIVLSEISPLSYNVIGHMKTIIIISCGAYLFNMIPSNAMMLGISIAIIGVFLYAFEKEKQIMINNPLINSKSSSFQSVDNVMKQIDSYIINNGNDKDMPYISTDNCSLTNTKQVKANNMMTNNSIIHDYRLDFSDSIRFIDDRKCLNSNILV